MWTGNVRLIATGVLTAAAALLLMPDPHRLPEQATGDPELVAMVRATVDDPEGYRGLSVALVEGGRVRFAGLGDRGDGAPIGPDTPFEIGSVTKVLTGMLLADLVADGTVAPSGTLGTALGISGESAGVTLEELASHRSGLPRLPLTSPALLVRLLWANLSAGNPYGGQDRDDVVGSTSRLAPGGGRGTVSYSNLGVAVLGHALAAHTGTTYAELLQRRLLGPLGMSATTVVHSPHELPSQRALGAHASGRDASPWIGAGYAPAGVGVWSTAADLSLLLEGVLSGRAPGVDAAAPRFDAGDNRSIGYGWLTTRYADREITWHNGGTGGFSAFVGFDPTAGRGVVVLGNTDKDVDPVGLRLLGVSKEDAGGAQVGTPGWIGAAIGLVFPLLGGWSLRSAARQGPDRLAVISAGAWAVAMLLLAHRLGNWLLVPAPLWAAGVGFTAGAMALAVPRIKELPTTAPGRTRRRWTESACSLAFALAGVGAALI